MPNPIRIPRAPLLRALCRPMLGYFLAAPVERGGLALPGLVLAAGHSNCLHPLEEHCFLNLNRAL